MQVAADLKVINSTTQRGSPIFSVDAHTGRVHMSGDVYVGGKFYSGSEVSQY